MVIDENQVQTVAQIVAQTADATAKVVAQAAQDAAIVYAKENYATHTAIAVLQTEMTVLKNHQLSLECNINKKVDELMPKFVESF